MDVFWSSHDPTQVFGQGPDVGDQYRYGFLENNTNQLIMSFTVTFTNKNIFLRYRSAIFFQGPEQENLALLSKVREEAKLEGGSLTTGIEPAAAFFPAEPEHQVISLPKKYKYMLEKLRKKCWLITEFHLCMLSLKNKIMIIIIL